MQPMPNKTQSSIRRLLGLWVSALTLANAQAAAPNGLKPPLPEPLLAQAGQSAKSARPAQSSRAARQEKPKKAQRSRVIAPRNHEETRAERERRFLRECRGKPNAGACEGYAS